MFEELKAKRQARKEMRAEYKAMVADRDEIVRRHWDVAREKIDGATKEFRKYAEAHDISSDTDFVRSADGKYIYSPGIGRSYNSNKAMLAIEYNEKLAEYAAKKRQIEQECDRNAEAEFIAKYGDQKVAECNAYSENVTTVLAFSAFTICIVGMFATCAYAMALDAKNKGDVVSVAKEMVTD